MSTPISDKLKIKAGYALLTINAPSGFKKEITDLPEGVSIDTMANTYDQVHWFVFNKSQLEKELAKVMRLLKPGITVWVYYPKSTSNMQTDLTRDKGWDSLMNRSDKLTWVNLISFNETWSAFGFRVKTEADKKKVSKPKADREIFNWVNPDTKEVKLPEDLTKALKKHPKAQDFFENLSFTNKKEYIEWIVTAKKDETRIDRIAGTIERLEKEWKNPRNT